MFVIPKKIRIAIPANDSALIIIEAGELPSAVDQAEAALLPLAESLGIYQRGGELVRIIRLAERKRSDGLDRPSGTVQLQAVRAIWLLETLERIAHFAKLNPKGQPVQTNCPNKIPATYLARVGEWKLPVLQGIVSAPLVREDGSVLNRPGYDAQTALYFSSREEWPPIPNEPSRDDAAESLQSLLEPFAEFPFVSQEDAAVHVACILTGIQRRVLAACPLVGYSAPVQRSGKSLLAESAAVIAMGRPAPATSFSPHREEIRKSITSVLREGHSVVALDNIEHVLHSPDLARAITQSEYQDRLLSKNRMLRLPTTVLWTATGNNLTFKGDLSARAVLCRIDARIERPERRSFRIANLPCYLREHRTRLVGAALTILRAFYVAGCPNQRLSNWGGFEDWSNRIRAPLVWAGATDPVLTRESVLDDDPDKESSATALAALAAAFGDAAFTLKEVAEQARAEVNQDLYAALLCVGAHRGGVSPNALGFWARRWRDRIIGRHSLKRANTAGTGTAKWKIVQR